jgi:hypothetical protein
MKERIVWWILEKLLVSGCGGQSKKRFGRLRKDEGIGRNKLGGME